ncbi:MAG: DNA alkylation repair protein [Clostridiales bacterium]|nr:DNA alkylation repair protein [Clostridiales bacterium]
MTENEVREILFAKQDVEYRDFQAKLIPGTGSDTMIGVRTPDLRSLAKELVKRADVSDFLNVLPHRYFDENQLHAFIISEMRDFDSCMDAVCRFLPYVDNWATCDQMNPKVFGKKQYRTVLLEQTKKWMKSKKTYEVRFGIRMLMCHFLDESFDPKFLQMVAKIRSEEYYINMMIAWFFATALAKQYDAAVAVLEKGKRRQMRESKGFGRNPRDEKASGDKMIEDPSDGAVLSSWVQNKSIQKAVESYRITDEQKTYLRTLKV